MGKKIETHRTPKGWKDVFLADLRKHGNVRHAAKMAKVGRVTAYSAKKKSKTFAAQWEDALEEACDILEKVARDRAMDQSDRLLEFLLKAHRPEKYRERHQVDFSGKMETSGVLRVPARLSVDEWVTAAAKLSEYQKLAQEQALAGAGDE